MNIRQHLKNNILKIHNGSSPEVCCPVCKRAFKKDGEWFCKYRKNPVKHYSTCGLFNKSPWRKPGKMA